MLACLVVSAALGISFQQAIAWWGVTFAATVTVSWILSLGLVLLYRYLVLPSVTDFF